MKPTCLLSGIGLVDATLSGLQLVRTLYFYKLVQWNDVELSIFVLVD